MATFSSHESEIIFLAQSIILGLNTQAQKLSKLPYHPQKVQAELDALGVLHTALTHLQAHVTETTNTTESGLPSLTHSLKALLRYMEHAAYSRDHLAHSDWSNPPIPASLNPPDQSPAWPASQQRGPGWVFLDWSAPINENKPNDPPHSPQLCPMR